MSVPEDNFNKDNDAAAVKESNLKHIADLIKQEQDQENELPLLLVSSLNLNLKKANPLRIINSDKADLDRTYPNKTCQRVYLNQII